ncbi:MAG: long-chain fatty acid--CoA ligase [Candidatus Rokuibacteriota bacterium]|nr:MAG: long-chain fatty acid--CoA ligase [Candidatus Rokubacteria bacterium]
MHVRGIDLWPAEMVRNLVEETHVGRRMRCYPADRPRTLTELLDRAVERFPDRDAVVDASEQLTWRELRERVRRLAASLARRHGIKAGDRIALLLRNGPPFCVGVFACAQLGAIAVTLNTKLKSTELEFMLQNSGARVLLTNPEWWPQIESIRDRLPCEAYHLTPYPELFSEPASSAGPSPSSEDDTAFIMYTSGTTGRPKGAMGTHLGIINSAITFERCYRLSGHQRTLVAVPLFHVTGLIAQFLTMAYLGGTTVVMATFDAAEALRLIDAARITHMVAAPTVLVMLMLQPGYRRAGASLQALGYGGAPIASETVTRLREWLPGCRLHNTYGLTESSSPATCLPDADALSRVSSVGWPVPTAEVRTVEPGSERDCAPDEVGELLIRGPMVVPGYWGNPEATAATMGDGWLRTGDLARIDRDGYVTIMDRIKDMINRGGEKIFCVEVEEVLCAHPSVMEAAVVGVPDPVYGESVKACVVPRPGATVEPEQVRAWVRARLAKFKVPRDVAVLDALPRNPNGKVMKGLLR